ncbi:MAG: caspase family protein [Hyphomicrobiales bacterium]
MLRALGFLVILALAACLSGPLKAESRVALIIGNGAYRHATQLPNPGNDAADVAEALKRSGFETIVGLDLDQSRMQDAMIRFSRAARDADVALFYYSGHAMQFGGVNYLMPVDARLADEADLRRMARVDEIVADLQKAKNLRILVLDACRDNPLADQLGRSIGKTRAAAMGRGLARIESPQGMIVAFSTQSGRTADDGSGRNSPYTSAFLKHIETAQEIGLVFRSISEDVYRDTGQQQLPELSLSLIGRYYLRGAGDVPVAAPAAPLPPSAAAQAWELVKDTKDTAVLEAFLQEHPDGLFGALAQAKLKELKRPKVAVGVFPEKPADGAVTGEQALALCDELAADRYDTQAKQSGVTRGLMLESVKGEEAVRACEAAVREAPGEARYLYQLGRALYRALRFGESIATLEKAAQGGHMAAMRMLADFHASPKAGLRRDLGKAVEWRLKAAEAGDTAVTSDLIKHYWKGTGVEKDRDKAAEWFGRGRALLRQRAEAGDGDAMYDLGSLLAYAPGRLRNETEAVTWYQRAAEKGSVSAMSSLISHYTYPPYGFSEDSTKADYWKRQRFAIYMEQARKGDASAMDSVGSAYMDGYGTAKNEIEGHHWRLKAAEAGYFYALSSVAIDYQYGNGVSEDKYKADQYWRRYYEWRIRAAEAGDADAKYYASDAYEDGEGAPKDEAKSLRLLREAADMGHTGAMTSLAINYEYGGDTYAANQQESYRWYRRSGEAENWSDTFEAENVAEFLDSGKGVRRNPAEAAQILLRGYDQEGDISEDDFKDISERSVEMRRQFQMLLKSEGFYNGAIDGQLGPATFQALLAYIRR